MGFVDASGSVFLYRIQIMIGILRGRGDLCEHGAVTEHPRSTASLFVTRFDGKTSIQKIYISNSLRVSEGILTRFGGSGDENSFLSPKPSRNDE